MVISPPFTRPVIMDTAKKLPVKVPPAGTLPVPTTGGVAPRQNPTVPANPSLPAAPPTGRIQGTQPVTPKPAMPPSGLSPAPRTGNRDGILIKPGERRIPSN
jgi:hypothetical protein